MGRRQLLVSPMLVAVLVVGVAVLALSACGGQENKKSAMDEAFGVSYCCPNAAKAPDVHVGGYCFLRDLQVKKRADERTRTADLLITSDQSGIAGVCRSVQFPHI